MKTPWKNTISTSFAKESIRKYARDFRKFQQGSKAFKRALEKLHAKVANCIGRPAFAYGLAAELEKIGVEKRIVKDLRRISEIRYASGPEFSIMRHRFAAGFYDGVDAALKQNREFKSLQEKNPTVSGLVLEHIERINGKSLRTLERANKIIAEFINEGKTTYKIGSGNNLFLLKVVVEPSPIKPWDVIVARLT